MSSFINISVSPEIAGNPTLLRDYVCRESGVITKSDIAFVVRRKSVDARSRSIKINLKIEVYSDGVQPSETFELDYKKINPSKIVHIIGSGPAGLFAALRCLEQGIKPIIFERGKDVRSRRWDIAAIHKQHLINPDSNYCFGEGGAGTYSDGKLFTRSGRKEDIEKILRTLVSFGAGLDILVDAHPHIGTNKLPGIIENIRKKILELGGEIHFEHRLVDLNYRDGKISSIIIEEITGGKKDEHECKFLLLATGHSARDIFYLLHEKKIRVEAKPFAMGVRVEHPQQIIDGIQYHCSLPSEISEIRNYLPAAPYSIVQQVNDRGVYSFCMCPGGIIAPCATGPEQIVTNGWSPSKRNNPYANSGIVVELRVEDFKKYESHGPFAGLAYQQDLEKSAWLSGGRTQTAPAQRLTDFMLGKISATLPDCSYQPGVKSAPLDIILGPMIAKPLRAGFKTFGEKMKGYMTEEAIIVGVESRTSTPVRIPRDKETCEHPEVNGLYPCGEGAGFAGGIISAALDGERCINAILKNYF